MKRMEAENQKRDSWKIFNRIAPRYDFLNCLLSFRQDVRWRKEVLRILTGLGISVKRYLDVATGTCDQLLELCRHMNIDKIVGLDMSKNMLRIGLEKINKRCPGKSVYLVQGDSMNMGFKDNYFDLITVSFGIRNLSDLNRGLAEIHRVLVPQGYLIVLEFSLPENYIFKKFYLFYFRRMLPKLGGVLSGDKQAYRYLNNTVEAFPYGDVLNAILTKAGFIGVNRYSLLFGIATIYSAKKSGGEVKEIEELIV
jgi:demethylmenaquinone methyltransferase/2-methoxy-6-polyprenyl-1,4-benzoquinol methylase